MTWLVPFAAQTAVLSQEEGSAEDEGQAVKTPWSGFLGEKQVNRTA